MTLRIIAIFLTLSVIGCATEEKKANSALHEANRAAVDKLYQQNIEKYKDNKDMLVLPGLLADRAKKQVILQAEVTAVEKGSPVEFFLTSQNSGRDYEALAVSMARPSDVHKALVFIGMEPGKPVDPKNLRFWPKGERVVLTVSCETAKPPVGPIRIEKTILDSRTGKPLPEAGMVFAGSVMVESKGSKNEKVYSADIDDRGALAPNYNEPFSVLDEPRQATQQEVYGHLVLNPDFLLPKESLVQITMEPELKDGKKRVRDLSLAIAPKAGAKGQKPDELEFRVTDAEGKQLNKDKALNQALELFSSLSGKGIDPFVTVKFDGKLSLQTVRDLIVKVLSPIDTEKGIRIEPPPEGQLYYRAFMPPESFRDRAQRRAQPWELRLSAGDAPVKGILSKVDEVWSEDKAEPDFKTVDHNVAGGAELRKQLDEELQKEKERAEKDPDGFLPRPRAIIVFADGRITLEQFMSFMTPALTTHPLVHVYVEAPPSK